MSEYPVSCFQALPSIFENLPGHLPRHGPESKERKENQKRKDWNQHLCQEAVRPPGPWICRHRLFFLGKPKTEGEVDFDHSFCGIGDLLFASGKALMPGPKNVFPRRHVLDRRPAVIPGAREES